MALTQLTQLTGQSGISTTIDYTMSDLVVDTISVGGTITYNDVTSVDSIGIITARKGIQVIADGLNVTGVSTLTGNTSITGVVTATEGVTIPADSKHLRIGAHADGDLLAYHDGTKSVIVNYTGDFHLRSNDGSRSSKEGIILKPNGSTELYHSGSKKFETTSSGATVTGALTATSFVGGLPITSGADNRVITASSASAIQGETNLTYDGTNMLVNGTMLNAVQLKFGNSGLAYIDHNIVGQDIQFRVGNSSALDTSALRIHSNGNMSLGSTSAPTKFGIRGTSATTDATMQIVGNSVSTLLLGQDADGGVIRGQGGNNALKFKVGGGGDTAATTGGTEALRIHSTGVVQIGDSTASSLSDRLLQIGKTDRSATYLELRASTSGVVGLVLSDGTSGDAGYRGTIEYNHNDDSMFFKTAATERLRIHADGEVECKGGAAGQNALLVSADYSGSGNVDIQTWQRIGGAVKAKMTYKDADTSMHFGTSTAHKLCLTTGGTERLRITNTGKVGINSTSPTYALEVDGGTQNTVIVARSSDAKAAISFLDNTSGGYGRATIGGEGDEVYITSGAGVEALRARSTGDLYINGNQTGNNRGIIYNHAGGFGIYASASSGVNRDIIFYSNAAGSSRKFTIRADGRFGFNTEAPYAYDTTATVFEVVGSVASAADIEVARFRGGQDANGGTAVLRLTNNNDRGLVLKGGRESDAEFAEIGTSSFNGTYNRAIRIDASGNMGLGTNAPNHYNNYSTITLNGATGGEIDFEDDGTLLGDHFCNVNGHYFTAGRSAAMPFIWQTHNGGSVGQRMQLTATGQLNIGGDLTQTAYQTQITGDLLLQKNQAAYQHPQIELYATNTGAYGGAIKFTGHYNSKYQLALIKAYGGNGSPGSSGGSLGFSTGDGNEKLRIAADGDIDFRTTNEPAIIVDSGNANNGSGLKVEIDGSEQFRFDPSSIEYKKNNTRGTLLAPLDYYNNTNHYIDLTQWRASDNWNVLEVFGTVNPNSSGSGAYADPVHMYIYRGTGWDQANTAIAHWVYCASVAPPARHAFPSGTGYAGNSGISAVWYTGSAVRGNKSSTSTDYVRILIPNANSGNNFVKTFRVMRRY